MTQRLTKLSVSNFRLFRSAEIETDSEAICFHGLNGAGKTSLLEAIHYLCIGQGHFSQTDKQNIRFGENFFRIEGTFSNDEGKTEIACSLEEGKRKAVSVNGKAQNRISEHLGKFPAVVIAPDDVQIIVGSGEQRRTFLNNMISQVSGSYAESLQGYNKALRQRNALLKQFGESGRVDEDLLRSYDEPLVRHGQELFAARTGHIKQVLPAFMDLHRSISSGHEEPGLQYVSELQQKGMSAWLNDSIEHDIIMERTLHGPHRDDLDFSIDGEQLKRYGSQGQVKTFLIALKICLFRFLKNALSKTPLLLLDDLFDKLDEERAHEVLRLAISDETGQIFITETQQDRVKKYFEEAGKTVSYVHIKEGEIEWPAQMRAQFERSSATS